MILPESPQRLSDLERFLRIGRRAVSPPNMVFADRFFGFPRINLDSRALYPDITRHLSPLMGYKISRPLLPFCELCKQEGEFDCCVRTYYSSRRANPFFISSDSLPHLWVCVYQRSRYYQFGLKKFWLTRKQEKQIAKNKKWTKIGLSVN